MTGCSACGHFRGLSKTLSCPSHFSSLWGSAYENRPNRTTAVENFDERQVQEYRTVPINYIVGILPWIPAIPHKQGPKLSGSVECLDEGVFEVGELGSFVVGGDEEFSTPQIQVESLHAPSFHLFNSAGTNSRLHRSAVVSPSNAGIKSIVPWPSRTQLRRRPLTDWSVREGTSVSQFWLTGKDVVRATLGDTVAFACPLLQSFPRHDVDAPTRIEDETSFLQLARKKCHGRPSDTDHLRQQLLRERQFFAWQSIVGSQQPRA
jgi:hypothetical protein